RARDHPAPARELPPDDVSPGGGRGSAAGHLWRRDARCPGELSEGPPPVAQLLGVRGARTGRAAGAGRAQRAVRPGRRVGRGERVAGLRGSDVRRRRVPEGGRTGDSAPPAELVRAVEQFNRGEFFECHETLEALWMAEAEPLRRLYQGILQVGV